MSQESLNKYKSHNRKITEPRKPCRCSTSPALLPYSPPSFSVFYTLCPPRPSVVNSMRFVCLDELIGKRCATAPHRLSSPPPPFAPGPRLGEHTPMPLHKACWVCGHAREFWVQHLKLCFKVRSAGSGCALCTAQPL